MSSMATSEVYANLSMSSKSNPTQIRYKAEAHRQLYHHQLAMVDIQAYHRRDLWLIGPHRHL